MIILFFAIAVSASWSPPTEGSPVEHYILQISRDGGPFETVATTPDTTYQVELEHESTYIARVAGVDAQQRQGPWSEPSEPYSPFEHDLSGQPGQPWRVR